VFIWITVKNSVLLTLEESLLKSLGINHRWTEIEALRVETSWSLVAMFGANFVINGFESASFKTSNLGCSLTKGSLGDLTFVCASVVFDTGDHSIETGRGSH